MLFTIIPRNTRTLPLNTRPRSEDDSKTNGTRTTCGYNAVESLVRIKGRDIVNITAAVKKDVLDSSRTGICTNDRLSEGENKLQLCLRSSAPGPPCPV